MLAIGEQLQAAVTAEQEGKAVFRDDICGISFCVKSGGPSGMVAVSIWNRDGGNEVGKMVLLELVRREVPRECCPKEGMFYYKRHEEHVGFGGKGSTVAELEESIAEKGVEGSEVSSEMAKKGMGGSKWSTG